MLYLFGQLALSDSLDYHENFDIFDCSASVAATSSEKPAGTARPLAADQQWLRLGHPVPQTDCAASSQQHQ